MPRSRIPKFKSEAEEARFWDTHDTSELLASLKEVKVRFPKPRKRLVSIRMNEDHLAAVRKIAETKGIGYLSLIRMWVAERLAHEARHFSRGRHV